MQLQIDKILTSKQSEAWFGQILAVGLSGLDLGYRPGQSGPDTSATRIQGP
jgi:hypothetical protein